MGVGRVYCPGGELNPSVLIARNPERRAPRGTADECLSHARRNLSYLVTAHEAPIASSVKQRAMRVCHKNETCKSNHKKEAVAWKRPLRLLHRDGEAAEFLYEATLFPMIPVACWRALIDLSDDVATKIQVLFYADAADALRKALHD
jgi:hypothetical protein